MTNAKTNKKIYRGLYLSPSFEDRDYWYYPLANGSVWVESKIENFGYSATRDSNEASATRNETLDRWFNLAD